MKRNLFLLLLCVAGFSASAQEWLWPISGQKAGANIIYAPQSYINSELNFANLFIGAPHGAVVVAPVDGVVNSVNVGYNRSLSYSNSWGLDPGDTFNSALSEIRKDAPKDFNPQFISGTIGISVNDGVTLWIRGLEGDKVFKTGQKIQKGDTIGTVAYCYRKIAEPSITLSVSKRTGAADPMTPFGLKSSFVPPAAAVKVDSITRAQAKEDLDVLFGATEELLPTLEYLASPDEFAALREELDMMIDTVKSEQISTVFFQNRVMRRFNHVIHDSHIYIPPHRDSRRPRTQPQIIAGWQMDTLRVYMANDPYKEYLGREVVEINGYTADSARKIAEMHINSYDADVRSIINAELAFQGSIATFKDGFNLDVVFADGTKLSIPESTKPLEDFGNVNGYFMHNRHANGWASKILNDSTALLELSTFSLNQIAVEDIGKFVDSVEQAGIENFIVDVRNNSGGDIEVLEKLFSYFATDTTELNTYSHVKRIAGYKYLDYSLNYAGTDTLFAEFSPIEGKEGYYANYGQKNLAPDSLVNYTGRLYVLTNEYSASAATEFAGYAVRAHRGVVIGRETQSAYHYLTAMKHADIRLPNSTATIRLPLVEQWFDTLVNERVPFGRGVLPDYEIRLTHDELMSRTVGDTILNKALELIDKGVYLKAHNPFDAVQEVGISGVPTAVWVGAGSVTIVVGAYIALRARKRRK